MTDKQTDKTSLNEEGRVSDHGDLNDEENALPTAPDGGWGWVIVVVSFICCGVVDGMCSVFGVLLPKLHEYFEESMYKTALAGSVLAGGFLLSGPVASIVINCSSCRLATICGGLLASIAFVSCTYSPNVDVFILIFGAAGGLGIGLIYLPASVMVGFYFEKHRAIAVGISSSGAGIGMLILAPLAAFLVQEYGWKGTLIILAGVPLQCVVCGALMRPLTFSRRTNLTSYASGTISFHPEKTALEHCPTFSKLPEIHEETCTSEGVVLVPENTEECLICDSEKYDDKLISYPEFLTVCDSDIKENQINEIKKFPVELASPDNNISSLKEAGHQRNASNTSLSSRFYSSRSKQVSESESTKDLNGCENADTSFAHCNGQQIEAAQSIHGTGTGTSFGAIKIRKSVSSVTSDPTVNPLVKKDIFYSGSISSLHRWTRSQTLTVGSQTKYANPEVATNQGQKKCQPCVVILEMFDISIFRNISFLIICAASTFIQLGYFVPMVFVSAYAMSLDISPSAAAFILSVIGMSNMIGRAGAGALANVQQVNILHLNNMALIVSGLATVCVGWCTTYTALLVYAAIFGLSVAAFVPITTMFLVRYVGLDRLTNSYGLLSMVKGLSSMAGPPIAGALFDKTASYYSTFYFAGAMFTCAGLLFYTLPFTQRTTYCQEFQLVHPSDNFNNVANSVGAKKYDR